MHPTKSHQVRIASPLGPSIVASRKSSHWRGKILRWSVGAQVGHSTFKNDETSERRGVN
jgi:hypothetical protein